MQFLINYVLSAANVIHEIHELCIFACGKSNDIHWLLSGYTAPPRPFLITDRCAAASSL